MFNRTFGRDPFGSKNQDPFWVSGIKGSVQNVLFDFLRTKKSNINNDTNKNNNTPNHHNNSNNNQNTGLKITSAFPGSWTMFSYQQWRTILPRNALQSEHKRLGLLYSVYSHEKRSRIRVFPALSKASPRFDAHGVQHTAKIKVRVIQDRIKGNIIFEKSLNTHFQTYSWLSGMLQGVHGNPSMYKAKLRGISCHDSSRAFWTSTFIWPSPSSTLRVFMSFTKIPQLPLSVLCAFCRQTVIHYHLAMLEHFDEKARLVERGSPTQSASNLDWNHKLQPGWQSSWCAQR